MVNLSYDQGYIKSSKIMLNYDAFAYLDKAYFISMLNNDINLMEVGYRR